MNHKGNLLSLFQNVPILKTKPANKANGKSPAHSPTRTCHLPDGAEELAHGQLPRNQELGLVQRRQELLPGVAFHYHLSRGSVPESDSELSLS